MSTDEETNSRENAERAVFVVCMWYIRGMPCIRGMKDVENECSHCLSAYIRGFWKEAYGRADGHIFIFKSPL